MSTTTVSHPSLPIPLFTQLVRRLRYANARYDQIAHQCCHTQRLTYHAKRRAYRAGLHIDTFKARATWLDGHLSAASIQPLPVLDRTAGSPPCVVTEIETEEDYSDSTAGEERMLSVDLGLTPRRLAAPEVVVQKAPATPCLSPLGLGLSLNLNPDDADASDLPVPGAPRWRARPLPEDECGVEPTTFESMSFSSCTYYDPVCRGMTYVSGSAPTQLEVVYAGHGLGITVPPRRVKRKRGHIEAEEGAVFSRRPRVGVPADGCFSGAWWNNA